MFVVKMLHQTPSSSSQSDEGRSAEDSKTFLRKEDTTLLTVSTVKPPWDKRTQHFLQRANRNPKHAKNNNTSYSMSSPSQSVKSDLTSCFYTNIQTDSRLQLQTLVMWPVCSDWLLRVLTKDTHTENTEQKTLHIERPVYWVHWRKSDSAEWNSDRGATDHWLPQE